MAKLLVIVTLSALCSAGSGLTHATIPNTSDIMQDIAKIKTENNENARAQLSDDMSTDIYEVWKAKEMDSLDDKVLDGLIGLLDDTNDTVRGASASAVGYFGLRAKRAVPALRNALILLYRDRERKGLVIAPAIDSSAFISEALKRIQSESNGQNP